MATAKRSALDEAPLADLVTDETSIEARVAGGTDTEADREELARLRAEKIELIIKEHQVPRAIAVIIADTGYSKGTANRIYNDQQKRARQAREAAQVGAQARTGKAAKSAEANA